MTASASRIFSARAFRPSTTWSTARPRGSSQSPAARPLHAHLQLEDAGREPDRHLPSDGRARMSAGTAVKVWKEAPEGTPEPDGGGALWALHAARTSSSKAGASGSGDNGHGHTGVPTRSTPPIRPVPGYFGQMVAAYGEERATQILGEVRHNTVYFPNIMVKGPIQSCGVSAAGGRQDAGREHGPFAWSARPTCSRAGPRCTTASIDAPTSMVGHDDLEMYERAQEGLQPAGVMVNLRPPLRPAETRPVNAVTNGT